MARIKGWKRYKQNSYGESWIKNDKSDAIELSFYSGYKGVRLYEVARLKANGTLKKGFTTKQKAKEFAIKYMKTHS